MLLWKKGIEWTFSWSKGFYLGGRWGERLLGKQQGTPHWLPLASCTDLGSSILLVHCCKPFVIFLVWEQWSSHEVRVSSFIPFSLLKSLLLGDWGIHQTMSPSMKGRHSRKEVATSRADHSSRLGLIPMNPAQANGPSRLPVSCTPVVVWVVPVAPCVTYALAFSLLTLQQSLILKYEVLLSCSRKRAWKPGFQTGF